MSPCSSTERAAISERSSLLNRTSISEFTRSASVSEVVMSTGFARMSCSAWASRSAAHRVGLASSSAMTSVSVGPYQAVNTDLPEHELLGECREEAARAADHVHLGDRLRPVGHGGDGLRPANLKDTVRARYVGGHQHNGMDSPVDSGIRRNDDLIHAGNPGGNDGHQHSRREPCRSTRNVNANALDRVYQLAVPFAEIDPALRPAHLLKSSDPTGGQPESVDNLAVDGIISFLDCGRRHLQVSKLHAIEPFGYVAHGIVAALPDARDDVTPRLTGRHCLAEGGLGTFEYGGGRGIEPMPRPVSRASLESSSPYTILMPDAPRRLGPCLLWRRV